VGSVSGDAARDSPSYFLSQGWPIDQPMVVDLAALAGLMGGKAEESGLDGGLVNALLH